MCRNCLAGRQRYCAQMPPMVTSGARPDGTSALRRPGGGPVHSHFFGQSSFSTRLMTWERSVVKVADDAPVELLGPLACGLSTGAGAVFNALAPPAGSSIAIFGTGAVGLSALLAARERGCTRIVAIDKVAARLSLATEFGATEAIDAGGTDPVDALRELTGGDGVDFTLECTGNVAVLRQAVDALAMPGVCGVIGGAPAGAEFSLDHLTVLWGRTVRGILGGEGQSEQLIPALIDLQRLGRFPFDRLVEYFELDRSTRPWRPRRAARSSSRCCGCRRNESGRPDLNRGPPAPKAGALPGCATPRGRASVITAGLAPVSFLLASGPADGRDPADPRVALRPRPRRGPSGRRGAAL